MKKQLLALISSFCIGVCSFAQEKNSLGMEMVQIPSGTFYMGDHGLGYNRDEAPIHQVAISRDFYMSVTEVTNAQYEQFDPEHKQIRGKFGLSHEDDEAVIFVSYYEAKAFCDWLSQKEGKPYRLPTEAEWEYACKAGTYLKYWMDDGLPQLYHKNQLHNWGVNSSVSLQVGTNPANPFGLYDMHGNVEEWCEDWYGAYPATPQTDPVGPEDGLFKVTRGGSHSTPVNYLRSTNRMAMMPDDKHWLTGFRVVQGEMPSTPYLPHVQFSDPNQVSQQAYQWKQSRKEAFFEEPLIYVKRPECTSDIPFYQHNHCPAITWCENGDLLAIWFSTDDEAGREMTILASRLPAGTNDWTEPYEFFKVPDRNMTGSSLFHDGSGMLVHINGVEAAGTWQTLVMVLRTSTDNGATWSKPRLISTDHEVRNQVIAGMFKTREGWLVQLADATPWGEGGTAFHLSKDNGETWEDPGKGKENDFTEGGTGGSIAGIHAGTVQLENGDFLAFGRGNSIVNEQGQERMPMSISSDQGATWRYSASEFPPIDGGQRLVFMRLKEGPLLFISFTNHPYRLKNELNGIEFMDKEGQPYKGYGMFAALSFDEGKSWPVKKLLTDGKYRFMDGGAWTSWFEMDAIHAEPRGYLAATQTPDQTIHLVSSKNHYRFNLAWLLEDRHYTMNGLPFTTVQVNDPFWSPRFRTHAEITVPDVLRKCEEYGRVQNFAVAAGIQEGQFTGGSSWDDSDLFKALEAGAYQYALYQDEQLRVYMDSVIQLVANAQEEDGYLVTVMRINGERDLPWNIRSPRFSYMIWSHELYNFGHLYEAAVAHYEATGQTNLLDVAIKNADLLVRTFLTGDSLNYEVDGHPEVETGLLRLWKATGKKEYLLLTKRLLELRGDSTKHALLLEYDEGRNPYFFQDYTPVKEFDEPYGHGVRALYLYASMTDFAIYGGEPDYFDTLERLWENMVRYKMYITGGIGSRHKGEAFGEKYELPNFSAYNETCSSIANILWNYRMFRYFGEGKYMDICERVLYNAFLAGWGLNGCEYNYVNPLESDGHYHYNKGANQRQGWFETSCCPTNISRFIPQVREMIYSMDGKGIYVNLFVSGETTLKAGKIPVHLGLKGNYPWQGKITLCVDPEQEAAFPIHIRIPSWTGNTPLPGSDLYEYLTDTKQTIRFSINGEPYADVPVEKGYAILERSWKKGDVVTVDFPVEVRWVKAHMEIEDNKNKVMIERGPVVYCLEEADNGSLRDVSISPDIEVITRHTPDFLGGVTVIEMDNKRFIPYYSWGNRGANEMKVWINKK